MSNKISVVIITKNEEDFIERSVKSALFADEVLVLDSGSTDQTCSKAANLGAKVFFQEWLGFGAQKNKAIKLAKHDWVFVLDADEKISPGLKNEILKIIKTSDYQAFFVPRLNMFFGKYIKHCGLYPDYSIRLFNRNIGQFNEVPVHESFQTSCATYKLSNYIDHIAFRTVREFRNKQIKYALLHNKKPVFAKMLLSPIWVFLKIYFLRLGFLEGWRGLIIALVYSEYTFRKYSF